MGVAVGSNSRHCWCRRQKAGTSLANNAARRMAQAIRAANGLGLVHGCAQVLGHLGIGSHGCAQVLGHLAIV